MSGHVTETTTAPISGASEGGVRTANLRWLAKNLDFLRVPLNAVERAERQGKIPYWGANGIVDYVDQALLDERVILIGEDGAPFFDNHKDVAFISDGPIWPNNHIHIIKPNMKVINERYLCYFLNQVEYARYINGSTRDKLTQSQLGSIPISYPDIESQVAIADFLDRETARINQLIEKKKRLVELLGEKRSALITAAVTGKTVEGGDSGVGYRLKYLLQMKYGESLTIDDRRPGKVPVYGSNGKVGEHDRRNTLAPSIIVGRKGSHGKITWAETGGFCIDTAFYIDKRSCRGDLRYAYYLLQTLGLDETSKDAAVPGLDRFEAHNRAIVQIDLDTQKSIADFLDRETTRIDKIIEKTQHSIDLLKEFRAALITATVTGQIDVSDRRLARREEATRT